MKFYYLRLDPRFEWPSAKPFNPWRPEYDIVKAMLVVAPTEEEARILATANSGDENKRCPAVWENDHYTECNEITPEDFPTPTAIIIDYHEG